MSSSQCDVIVVGAGAAGLAAAIGLARQGFQVVVVEAASFAGAENWSGCVYFCENLAHPELLGPEGVQHLAWERRLVERGFFLTSGEDILGLAYRDPVAFRQCYTVLRPIFDHHLAQVAAQLGVLILSSTTAESLIRHQSRVVGVCTQRGPLYADLVFLAEGDASHLVTREGYETVHPGEGPKFLQGIKEVIELPPGVIEEVFRVGPEEGVAYEMLLRNGTLKGREVQLNMGGFLYTNRQSLSIGLVLPADNLHHHFGGDPNLLIEWFENLPALRPWLRQGKRSVFGAKLIRGGGIREVPTLVDEGLAIGGAASGIGIDFPYPNFTGPATFMGLLLARAAGAIRAAKETFSRANLERHYLEPLRRSHYWRDVEFLRNWPGYVKKTSFFFGPNLDLALSAARIWTGPNGSGPARVAATLGLVEKLDQASLKTELRELEEALRWNQVAKRPPVWRLILDGFLTTLSDLLRRPRLSAKEGGELRLHYRQEGTTPGDPPRFLRRFFERFRPVLAAAARIVYANNDTPLSRKLPAALELLSRKVGLIDLLSLGGVALRGYRSRGRQTLMAEAPQRPDLTTALRTAGQNWDARLAELGYETVKESHIHLLWPTDLTARQKVTEEGLWHVCPAHVYEVRPAGAGQLQLVVNHENCIKCETCWRTSGLVDWGRDGRHRFIYPVSSAASGRVLAAADLAGKVPPALKLRTLPGKTRPTPVPAHGAGLLEEIARGLEAFDRALAEEPRTVGQNRLEHLERLAGLTEQQCRELVGLVKGEERGLAEQMVSLAGSRLGRVQQGRLAWAAADGRQLRLHHLKRLGIEPGSRSTEDHRDESDGSPTVRQRLAALASVWRDLERGEALSEEHDTLLRSVLRELPAGLSTPRQVLLSELGAIEPSLAYRVAHHLWGRELAGQAGLEAEKGWGAVLDQGRKDWLVPGEIDWLILLQEDRVRRVKAGEAELEPVATLGLRGAKLARVRVEGKPGAPVPGAHAAWVRMSCSDLVAIAAGMAELLCRRAVEHAASRIQFPGLFHDEQNRDAIGKFGAIKRLISQAQARALLLRALADYLSRMTDSEDPKRATLLLDVAAHALGCAPGSVAWNAGQVFGGMAFSEDDVLAKFYRDAAAWRFFQGLPPSSGGTRLEPLASAGFLVLEAKRLGDLEDRFLHLVREVPSFGASQESLARLGGLVWASTILLGWIEERARRKGPEESERALLRVWLEDVAAELDLVGACHLQATPPALPGGGSDVTTHEAFLKSDSPYESGDFLLRPLDLARPRVVPELVESDPFLVGVNRDIREAMRYFETPRDGLVYERWLERNHRPSDEDLDYLRGKGYFRFPVPKEFGGEGRRKLEYYLLVINTQVHADFAISLTIQVSSSLGTTPILLARERDLPRAIKDLSAFSSDVALQQEIASGLERGDATLKARLHEAVLGKPVLKVLFHRFAGAWQQKQHAEALRLWREGCTAISTLLGELERRREACGLALRWVAAGHISGFALTEPSAGSDTARVATRARPRSVPVEREADGVLRFIPADGKEPRYLLDARRLEFRPVGVFYRWAEDQEPARIHFDEYDYETDDPARTPYYQHGSRRVNFSDIAQLREREGQLWYDYWELSGTKMWITNGRVCGLLCLYARSDEGVTGFIVDRHAEGLFIGKDEAKLGQQGSPTNEVSLVAVRVPRENVLGLEGRGQVNALETLNVGRCGIATSAMAQLRSVAQLARAFVQEHGKKEDRRLARIEEELFTAEALAFDVIGRLEHRETRSLRLESAIAKMFNTEALHRAIDLAEEIHGLAGQTCDFLVEKRRRDARVLTIYEGTNEVQRFFVLRELETDVAPRRKRLPPEVALEASPLEVPRRQLWERIDRAVSLYGAGVWQNPNLQASCFVLSEAVAWFKAAESTLGRLAWLERHRGEKPEPGVRAFTRCLAELNQRLGLFVLELSSLRRGFYNPAVRAAELLLDRSDSHPEARPARPRTTRPEPLRVVVIVEPTLPDIPRLHLQQGTLLEAHRVLSEPDRAALEVALRLREQTGVHLRVACVGRPALAPLLREMTALGADEVHLVQIEGEAIAPADCAAALAEVLGPLGPFDLILAGDNGRDEEGTLGPRTAALLGVSGVGEATDLHLHGEGIQLTDSRGASRTRALPGFVAVEAGLPLRAFGIEGYLGGLARPARFHPWPAQLPTTVAQLEPAGQASAQSSALATTQALTAPEAASEVLERLGIERGGGGSLHVGSIEEVARLEEVGVVALLSGGREGRLGPVAPTLLKGARLAATRLGVEGVAVVLVGDNETDQRRATGQVREHWPGHVLLVPLPDSLSGEVVRQRVLAELWPQLGLAPRVLLGEQWAERPLISLGRLTARIRRLAATGSYLLVETRRASGRLIARRLLPIPPAEPCWLCLSEEAEVEIPEGPSVPAGQVLRWKPRLEGFQKREEIRRLLEEVKRATGLVRLSDAEVIVDVGFGVGNRDGYEAVIVPLERALREAGAENLMIGGSRKVTEELKLLPGDRQIGQSGVSVKPRLLLAVGISGAPQHVNYIDPATVVIAFNRDPEAPLLTLNQRQARPRVFPVVGDLFETIPALIEALRE